MLQRKRWLLECSSGRSLLEHWERSSRSPERQGLLAAARKDSESHQLQRQEAGSLALQQVERDRLQGQQQSLEALSWSQRR